MKEMLKVENLTKAYPGFTLKNISFSLLPGQIMGLIGKNGAGKSTTLKSIVNMVHPDSGSVFVLGRSFLTNENDCKQDTGIVFGGIDYYPLKKLSSITSVTQRFYKNWEPEKYENYLKLFALDPRKRFKELSNGMKVKYLLALALSHNAKLFILDEPTSGLDPVSRDELLGIFRRIVADGERGILFSTHITSDLDRCADTITYIKNGAVLQSAGKEDFLKSFDHLKRPDESALTLEEIMLRTEREDFDETAI